MHCKACERDLTDAEGLREAERLLAEARADREVYKRVLDAIAEHLKSGAEDVFAASASTTYARVVALRAERDDLLRRLSEKTPSPETAPSGSV